MTKYRLGVQTALATALLCAPLFASAAYEAPSELFDSLQTATMPIGFSAEIHAHSAPNYLAFWLNGTSQEVDGKMLFDAKATVDVAMEKGKVRAKFDARSTGDKAYLLFKDMQGTFDDDIARLAASFGMKKWMEFPMEDMSMWNMQGDNSMMDMAFTMTNAAGANGSIVYTLTPTEAAMEEIREGFEGLASEMTMGQVESNLEDVTLTVVITTDAAGKFLTASATMNAKSEGQLFTLKSSAWRAAGTFAVTAPTEVYTWENGLFGFGDYSYPDYSDWPTWIGRPEYSDWTEDWAIEDELPRNWDEEMLDSDDGATMKWDDISTWDDQEAVDESWTPECNLSQLKRGECPYLVDEFVHRR